MGAEMLPCTPALLAAPAHTTCFRPMAWGMAALLAGNQRQLLITYRAVLCSVMHCLLVQLEQSRP